MNFVLTEKGERIFQLYKEPFQKVINQSFQVLLNTKHLYQNLVIQYPKEDELFEELYGELIGLKNVSKDNSRSIFDEYYELAKNAPWDIEALYRGDGGYIHSGVNSSLASLFFMPPTIKSYCKTCGRIEPFNFSHGADVLNRFIYDGFQAQVFSLTYVCQGCKGIPEVFLVRREGVNLKLSGRSPMEQVLVPKYIPENQSHFISDAIVAHQSKQTLSGIFQLRTFIEQYLRSKCSEPQTDDTDLLFTEYASSLPKEFKEKFPSLKDIYKSLSICIHFADPDKEVFEKAKNDIFKHFDAKRVHEIEN